MKFMLLQYLTCQPQERVRQNQTDKQLAADELFECIWLFYKVVA